MKEAFRCTSVDDLEDGDQSPGQAYFIHRVTLWPMDWIPVVVRTLDGRPFRALADDEELEPKRFFVGAFDVAVQRYPFDPGEPYPGPDSDLAVFRLPGGYQNVEIDESIAGLIELRQSPPAWVGLWLHGVYLDSRLLASGDTEVAFAISPEDLLARFARLELRLIDADTGQAAIDASATLKAETSAHRRADLSDHVPDQGGRLVFERIVPGPYDLTVTRQGHVIQRKLRFDPSQRVDLGDVEIGSGSGIRLLVLDEDGDPINAWLELAPYEPGRAADELYHPNLDRTTDNDGTYMLPLPDRPSIVRARPFDVGEAVSAQGYYSPRVGTANVLVDPSRPPLELRLHARPRVHMTFNPLTKWDPGHRLLIEDELRLIVAETRGKMVDDLQVEVVAGTYRVIRKVGDDELGSMWVEVSPDHPSVMAP